MTNQRRLKYLRVVLECFREENELSPSEIVASSDILSELAPVKRRPPKPAKRERAENSRWTIASTDAAIWLKHRNGTTIELLDVSNGWFRVLGPQKQSNVIFPFGGVEKQDISVVEGLSPMPVTSSTNMGNGGFVMCGQGFSSRQNGAKVTLTDNGDIILNGKQVKYKR